MLLRKHYLLAGIGDQYMRLDWDADFTGDEEVRSDVALYLDRKDSMRLLGMGMEFTSPNLGVGKTFAATHIAKCMIKDGESVRFIHFKDMVDALGHDRDDAIEEELRSVTYLVLDEVLTTGNAGINVVFEDRFEMLIRHRTNFNLPTIMTTNLTEVQLEEAYPRTYSLLSAKQMRVEMKGNDQRRNQIAITNLEQALNGEIRPIS